MRRHLLSSVRIFVFGEKLGRFLSQVAPKRVERLNINYSGKVNEVDTTAITRAVLKGFLQSAGGREKVNEVNAPAFAAHPRDSKLTESRLSAVGDYTDLLELSALRRRQTGFPSPVRSSAPPRAS